MSILITGSAGFIGFHLAKKILENSQHEVIGLDNFNSYYDLNLKLSRAKILRELNSPLFKEYKLDLCDEAALSKIFKENNITTVVHLAAQAGVRYSISNPDEYIQSNLKGFFNILEQCRRSKIKPKLICASSSSVYGDSNDFPLRENMNTDMPVSLYAATKKSNEVMAHSYSHLYEMHVTCLRFFTVYGEYGRPDMAYFNFTKAILEGKKIKLFNNGDLERDFTYIDDIVNPLLRLIESNKSAEEKKFRILNIGNGSPVHLKKFLEIIENECGKKAKIEKVSMQQGDVRKTYADVEMLEAITGYKPNTNIKEGLKKFIAWYRAYYEK